MDEKPERLTFAVVASLLQAGLTDNQIGEATGKTRNTVKRFRHNHKLRLNPENRQVIDPKTVRILVGEGWPGSRIADALGVHKTSVYDLMRKHNIKPASRRGRPRKGTSK